jgi:hypothetical protein
MFRRRCIRPTLFPVMFGRHCIRPTLFPVMFGRHCIRPTLFPVVFRPSLSRSRSVVDVSGHISGIADTAHVPSSLFPDGHLS